MTAKLETPAVVLGFLGLVGNIVITILPNWKVTAYIGSNIIVMETMLEGLWMNCQRQSIFRMQCKVYDSMLILPPELQAARGLMCVSILLAFLAVLLSICGVRGANCLQDSPRAKKVLMLLGGCIFVVSSIVTLTPVAWTCNTIIRDFYNPQLVDAQKRELGEALYIGWATSALLLIAGILFIVRYCNHSKDDEQDYQPAEAITLNGFKPESNRSSTHKTMQYV